MIRPIVFVIACTLVASTGLAEDHNAAELAQLRQELAEAQARIRQLEAENRSLRDRLQIKQKQAVTLERRVTELDAEKQTLEREQQAAAPSLSRLFTRSHDAGSNRTTVTGKRSVMSNVRGTVANHYLTMSYTHAGKEIGEPVSSLKLRVEAYYAGWVYKSLKQATFEIDGRVVTCPISDYDNISRRIGSSKKRKRADDEFFTITVPREVAEQMGRAKSVQMKLGRSVCEMTGEQVLMMATVADMMQGKQ